MAKRGTGMPYEINGSTRRKLDLPPIPSSESARTEVTGLKRYVIEFETVAKQNQVTLHPIIHTGTYTEVKHLFRKTSYSWVECLASSAKEALTKTQPLVGLKATTEDL